MLRRWLHVALWLVLVLLPGWAVAQVTATLDRDQVQLGETVTLNVRIEGQLRGGLPDLHVLDRDFEILGSSQNSSLSFVNGKASSELTLGVALRPRHAGKLEIPALAVAGESTAPLQLEVTAPDPAAAASAHGNLFMEAEVEPRQAMVGQQLSYVVKLYYATPRIGNASLDVPHVDGVEMTRVGNDLTYEAEKGGRTYRVLERRYALTPQHPGPLQLPAASFQGEMVDSRDPDSFFGVTVPVSAQAPALAVDVRPVPADWGKSTWLPARDLSLELEGWPDGTEPARVGQPLNLTMVLQATGLPFEALPELTLPALDGAKVYPEKPAPSTRDDGQWLLGRRQQTFAVVPERAGTLSIPETRVKWWNVLAGRTEMARIPAHSITVLPAGGGATPAPVDTAASSAGSPGVAAPTPATGSPWRWIALGSAALWLLSLLLWWWRRRRAALPVASTPDPAPSVRQLRQAFLAAARGDDAAAQARCLLAWARAERASIQHLGELASALDDDRQIAAITALQQQRYAPAATAGRHDLAAVFAKGFAWRRAKPPADGGPALAPLYPFESGE